MIIEIEINGARVIISGENLAVNVTQDDVQSTASKPDQAGRFGLPGPDQIKSLRKALGLSQTKFARRLLVTQATICRWERGYEKPSGPATMLLLSLTAAHQEAAQ